MDENINQTKNIGQSSQNSIGQTTEGNEQFKSKNLANKGEISGMGAFLYILKKTERLASAVYLMTNHFPESESLKRTLRDKSSEIVSFIVGYKNLPSSLSYNFNREVENRMIEIISLLGLSLNIGLISKMNFNIVQDEFLGLLEVIKARPIFENIEQNSETINPNYFEVNGSANKSNNIANSTANLPQQFTHNLPQSQELNSYKSFQGALSVAESTQALNESSKFFDKNAITNKTKLASNSIVDIKRNSRQNIILSLIKKRGEVTVKDVAEVIKNCSEKTIQRELISLVAAGLIKRVGERRWSKYLLA